MPTRPVLLTRPDADSRDVAAELAARGIESLTWPMTRIVTVDGALDVPADTGALVFTSRNGVTGYAAGSTRRDLVAWCVGDRTAEAARRAGFADVRSANGDVDDLARMLVTGPATKLLYLRGSEVSADLGALLSGSGHILESRVVYRAEPAGPPPEGVSDALSAGAVGAVAVWSRRAAAMVAEHAAAHRDWVLGHTAVVGISARAVEPLRSSRFGAVSLAKRPDGAAMIDAIDAAMRQ